MKTLSDFNFKGQTVLLRADLNSDIKKNKLIPSERIKQSAITIKELKKKGAKIIILAHQGRPGKTDFISLKQHAKYLNKHTKVKLIQDILGKKAQQEIKKLKPGQAILLDNIRKVKAEFHPEKKNNNLVKFFLPLIDTYINDAFSICHRNQTSITIFPKYFPHCAGRSLEKELIALKKINIKNCLYILGGAKPEDNLQLLNNKNKILATGLFGQMCLIAKGKNLGQQNKYLKKNIKNYNQIIKKVKRKLKNIETPIDFAVKQDKKRKELILEEFPSEYEIFDIGQQTQKSFIKEIKKAKTIYMKGPAGYCADKKFCKGTIEILKTISKNKNFSIIGGGHLSDAIKISKISTKKFNHLSLSGGALLRYLAGEKLPGLENLKK